MIKMKSNFFKTVAAIFTVATMIFAVSCEKNDDDNENQQSQTNDKSLVGTMWTISDEGDEEIDDGIMAHYIESGYIRFDSDVAGELGFSIEYEEYPENNMSYNVPFTYTYQAPNGTITVSLMGYTQNMTFVVNGNQMTVTATVDGETETTIFTKQS